MCYETKRRIADSLVVISKEKPLRKVTVKDIMSSESMNRQTFYYHFQDIYSVVEWIFREDFASTLTTKEEKTIEEWIEVALDIVQNNRAFYKRVLESVDREVVIRGMTPIIENQIERRLQLYETDEFVKQFIVRSLCHYILDVVEDKNVIKKEKIMTVVYGMKELLINYQ